MDFDSESENNVENEEKKVINLSQRLAQMSLMFTNKTYKA